MSFADTIRKAIKASGVSLYAVAKAAHVPYQSIHRFYNGGDDCRLSTAEKLCRVLGLDLAAVSERKGRDADAARKAIRERGSVPWGKAKADLGI